MVRNLILFVTNGVWYLDPVGAKFLKITSTEGKAPTLIVVVIIVVKTNPVDLTELDDLGIKGDDCVVGYCHWFGKGDVLPSITGASNTVPSIINLHIMKSGVLTRFVAALVVDKGLDSTIDSNIEGRFLLRFENGMEKIMHVFE